MFPILLAHLSINAYSMLKHLVKGITEQCSGAPVDTHRTLKRLVDRHDRTVLCGTCWHAWINLTDMLTRMKEQCSVAPVDTHGKGYQKV